MSEELNLEPIKARVSSATAAPWKLHECARDNGDEDYWVVFNESDDTSMMQRQDAEFIAHARSDVPALIAEIERLRAALGSRGVHEEQIRQLPTYAMNLYGTEFGGLIERDKVLAALRGVGTPQEKAQRQELINDLYRLFTMTTQEIAAEFGEARCKDDSARINYALELLADHVTDCATATDEPFFKPNADFKQVKDWVKAVPLSTPHQEEKAP